MAITKDDIEAVYADLQARRLHPRGEFDKGGRFYLTYNLTDVRAPSRAHPYSQMVAGRTKKYIKAIVEAHNPSTVAELRDFFTSAN